MTWLGRHPGTRLLGQYADEELDREARGRVYAHLAGCPNCRKRVEFIHALGGAAADLPHPRPPDGVLEEILRRRREGDRVILPLELETPGPRSRLAVRSAVAAILALVTGFAALVLFAPQATAGRSELVFDPPLARTGERIEVVYRPSLELAGESTLRLRMRWREAMDDPPRDGPLGRPFEATLERDEDGQFKAFVDLPGRAVTWAGSVESLSADRVDSNAGRLWEGLARDEGDRPMLAALVERHRMLEPRSGLAVADAATEITRYYPESAEGWSLRFAAERRALGTEDFQRRMSFHRGQFRELYGEHVRHSDEPVTELIALHRYARAVGDEEARLHLGRELQAEYPNHPTAVSERLAEYGRAFEADPVRLLDALESEWFKYGPVTEQLLRDGVRTALTVSRADQLDTWADRYERSGEDLTWLAAQLAGTASLADRRLGLLEAEVARHSVLGSADRRLVERRAEAEARRAKRERAARAELGRALIDAGRCPEGVDQLSASVVRGWSPVRFGALADGLRVCGAGELAIPYDALVAFDPLTPSDSATALRRRFEPALPEGEWTALLEGARAEFRGRMTAEFSAPGRLLAPDTPLVGQDGRELRLAELLDSQPTLMVLWDRLGGPSGDILEDLNQLASAGVRLLVVTAEIPNDEFSAFAAEKVRFPLVHDVGGVLPEQVDSYRIPQLLLLDRHGRIVYSPEELDDARRGLEALKEVSPPNA